MAIDTQHIAMRRVCCYCQPIHVIGAVCPACHSKQCEPICADLWLCDECRMTFRLTADSPETGGMCEAARRKWSMQAGLQDAVDLDWEMYTSPLPNRNAMRGLVVAVLIVLNFALLG